MIGFFLPKDLSTDNVVRTAISVVFSLVLGILTLASFLVLGTYGYNAYKNWQTIQSLDVVATGRIHHYEGVRTTTNPFSITHYDCVVVHLDGDQPHGSEKMSSDKSRCQNITRASTNWRQYAYGNPSSIGENVLFSVLFGAMFFLASYIIMRIPAGLFLLAVPSLGRFYHVITFLCMLPALIISLIFIYAGWQFAPSGWEYEGRPIKSYSVYITRDGVAYARPETMMDWTDKQKAGAKLSRWSD